MSHLKWVADPQYPELTLALTGSRIVGSYEKTKDGKTRWEIVSSFNVGHQKRDDSFGLVETDEHAKQELEVRFANWLEAADLSSSHKL